MDYQEALDYIYSFINYEKGGMPNLSARAYNLARMERLLELLGRPDKKYPAVMIAGTKGKGSTAALSAAGLRAAGYKVGAYTQPHLHTYRERMRIGETLISRDELADLTTRAQPAIETVLAEADNLGRITTYEIGTGLALTYFAEQQIDMAVLEIGLGGRLDAVNVVESVIAVISALSFDHMAVLGNTLPEIAGEKAGIIKPNGVCITAAQPPDAMAVLEKTARDRQATLYQVGWEVRVADLEDDNSWQGRRRTSQRALITALGLSPFEIDLPLLGQHQNQNAALGAGALLLQAQQPNGLAISVPDIQRGFATVSWPARLEVVQDEPNKALIVVDGAHNAASAASLRESLGRNFKFERVVLVVGTYTDKDIEGIFAELEKLAPAAFVLTRSRNPRATAPENLQERGLKNSSVPVHLAANVEQAVQIGQSLARPNDLICATGSLSIAAETRAIFGRADDTDD